MATNGSTSSLPKSAELDAAAGMSLVQIYLDAVTHQVITSEELAFVAGNHDSFDRTERKLSARLEHLISSGNISVGQR